MKYEICTKKFDRHFMHQIDLMHREQATAVVDFPTRMAWTQIVLEIWTLKVLMYKMNFGKNSDRTKMTATAGCLHC